MATKRRSYRGTPSEHRSSARASLTSVRAYQRDFNRYLARGNCKMALHSLGEARFRHGAYRSEIMRADPRSSRGVSRLVSGMERRFYKKCVK